MSHVRDVLKQKGAEVATIGHAATVLAAAQEMHRQHIGALVVMDGDKIVGIFTERDLLNRVVAQKKSPETTKISEVMTGRVAFCDPDTSLDACRSAMTKNKMRHLPVLENGKLVGILSSGDLLSRELRNSEEAIQYMHAYMRGWS